MYWDIDAVFHGQLGGFFQVVLRHELFSSLTYISFHLLLYQSMTGSFPPDEDFISIEISILFLAELRRNRQHLRPLLPLSDLQS